MAPELFAQRILRFVRARQYRPKKRDELALAMGIAEGEMGDFHAACKALIQAGRVVLGARQAVTLPPPAGRIVGTYRANPRGFGFVIPDDANSHGDLFIPRGKNGDAITGDIVAARVMKRGKRAGKMILEGRVVEVVRRGRSRFVGVLHQRLRKWFVIPDGTALHVPIFVGDPGAKGAQGNDQVVVEITQYPDAGADARGVIVKVLGPHGEPDVDTQSIIEQYQLPVGFDDDTMNDAREVIDAFDPEDATPQREDLRDLTIITIDPEDARDFDDAISLTHGKGAEVELGVHIADVAYFVREGRPLDVTAKARANSVYLPRVVLPMLPEMLSNGVCSLQEREIRLTKSAFITYDGRGWVKRARVANTVIRSAKRLTYQQAGKILDGSPGRTSAKIVSLLEDMEALAKRIRARRVREGMIELDLPDTELVHDKEGRVIDVVPADDAFTHKIIEMFMVEANEAVARLLLDTGEPYLRRIHDYPTHRPGEGLAKFVSMLGYDVPDTLDRFAVQSLLKKARGTEEAPAINFAILRSMQRAEYSPIHVGHYALASEHYCHFTSPIRRYPDLTVHRLIDRYLAGEFGKRAGRSSRRSTSKRDSTATSATLAEVVALGRHCSDMERAAEAAERELKEVLVLRLLEQHVGEAFDGMVSGVSRAGVYVKLDRFLLDGVLQFDQLGEDWWDIDASTGSVLGELSGIRLRIGHRLKVTISSVNVPLRKLDLGLAEPLTKQRIRGQRRGNKRNGKNTRRGGNTRANGKPKTAQEKPKAAQAKTKRTGTKKTVTRTATTTKKRGKHTSRKRR